MPTLEDYARHSAYTDPGAHRALLDALPSDIGALAAIVRNVIVHYRASRIPFAGARLDEINSRWVARILDVDQRRHNAPLAVPRVEEQRVAGCCRDFTLLTVAALRHHGIPARSRIGFAGYLDEGWNYDHVIVEHWDGQRWRFTDAQLPPEMHWPIDPSDVRRAGRNLLPTGAVFASAAEVWIAYRRGEVNIETYGVDPGLPYRGAWFVNAYVISELAHRQRDELLLWDGWGAMGGPFRPDPALDNTLIDEIAALLVAADAGDEAAEQELSDRYAQDDRLHPGARIVSHSPTGQDLVVDLVERAETPVPA